MSANIFTFMTALHMKSALFAMLMLCIVHLARRSSSQNRYLLLKMSVGILFVLPLLMLVLPNYSVPFDVWPDLSTDITESLLTDTVIESTATGERHLSTMTLLLIGYFAVSTLLLVRIAVGFLRTRMDIRSYHRIDQAQVIALFDQIRLSHGIENEIELVLDASGAGSYAWGIRKQVIALPEEFLTTTSDIQRTVLTHELIHVLRRDTAICLMARVLTCFYWINPAVWLLNSRLTLEMEQSCDDRAVCTGINAADYASHLLSVIKQFDAALRPHSAVAMARASSIKYRIRSLLNNEGQRHIMSKSNAIGIGGALVVLGIGIGAFAEAPNPAALPDTTKEILLAHVQRLAPDLCDRVLSEVSFTADTMEFKGHCRTETRVYAFLRSLEREGGVPKLSTFEKSEDGYNFRLLLANLQSFAAVKP